MEGWKLNMKVFITGGTGFIGRHVVQELQGSGNTLLLLSRQSGKARSLSAMANVSVVEGDLSDIGGWRSEVERFRPDAAIHLAWEGLPDYSAGKSASNLKYGLDLLTMLAEAGCKSTVSTGSCWEYGEQSGKVGEDMPVYPYNAFTAAKDALHRMGREIARESGMNFIWTRLFYVYGPGQKETSLIPYIIVSVKNGKKPELKTPSARNDFVYVGDVARAIAAILKKTPEYGVYNIGSGVITGVRQIIEIICNKFDFSCKINGSDEAAGSPSFNFQADISKIINDTGWGPEAGIEEGIQRTIDSYLGEKVDE